MRRLLIASLGLSLLGSQLIPRNASADPRWPGWRPLPGRYELPQERDDHRDRAELRALLFRFDRARAMNDLYQLQLLDNEARALAQAELRESQHELWQARRWGNYRDGYAERFDLEQARVLSMELDSVAGRQDPAALDYRRERIVRLLDLETRETWRDRRREPMAYDVAPRAYR